MFHPNLFHQVLVHAPLNLFWRLLGYNNQLNKLFTNELLYKQKCEKEFVLLHKEKLIKTHGYRSYYFIRSTHIKSKLYSDNGRVVDSDVDWIKGDYNEDFDEDQLIYFKQGRLINYATDEVLAEGLISATPIFDHQYILNYGNKRQYLIIDEDQSTRIVDGLFEFYDERKRFYGANDERKPLYDTISNKLLQGYNLVSYDQELIISFLLLNTGELYIIDYSKNDIIPQLITSDVIQISKGEANLSPIAVLHSNGKVVVHDFDRGGNHIQLKYKQENNCIKVEVVAEDILCYYRNDGTVAKYGNILAVPKNKIIPKDIIKLSQPIRSYIYDPTTVDFLVVTIDGNGYLYVTNRLLSGPPKLRYFGLNYLNYDSYLLAVKD